MDLGQHETFRILLQAGKKQGMGKTNLPRSLSITPEVLTSGLCWWGQESSLGHLPGRLVRTSTVMSTWGSQRCLKVTLAVTFIGLVLQNEG